MEMTNQELEVLKVVVDQWERSDLRDSEVPATNENIAAIARHALVHLRTHDTIDALDIATIVGKLKVGGYLLIGKEAASRDAAASIPHQHDPQLRWLNSLEDINEAGADKLRRFTGDPAMSHNTKDHTGKTLAARYKERFDFIVKHKIKRPVVEAPVVSPERAKADKAIAEGLERINKKIDAIRPRDFRSMVSGGRGQMAQFDNCVTELKQLRDYYLQNMASIQSGNGRPVSTAEKMQFIERALDAEFDKRTNTSIR
jgi:hypothetical protein